MTYATDVEALLGKSVSFICVCAAISELGSPSSVSSLVLAALRKPIIQKSLYLPPSLRALCTQPLNIVNLSKTWECATLTQF